ncbi:hypothetical protein LXL04_004974 [Taraxacum kok-saghyz]
MKEEVAILETVKPKQRYYYLMFINCFNYSLKLQYLQRRIDMLPKPLTEDICSLRADVERLAFSVIWEMTPEAHVISTRYTKSVIKSCAALSYVEAQARMDDSRLMDPVTIDLPNMNALAKVRSLSKHAFMTFPVAVTCGNTFVLKPSEKDPGHWASVMLAELAMEAGTNSNMGAKNHGIVMPDANIDATLNALVAAGFGAAGQRGLSFLLIMGSLVFTGLVNSLGCAVLAVFLYG